jgi:hypothetical protein
MIMDNKLPLHRCQRKLKERPVDESQHLLIMLNLKTFYDFENNERICRFRIPRLVMATSPKETEK